MTDLLEAACNGDEQAKAMLLESFRPRLVKLVRFRIDSRIQGRLDPADVVQETFVDVIENFDTFLRKRDNMSFFLWIRLMTMQRLARIHRQHLGARMRDASMEYSLYRGSLIRETSVSLAAQLLGRLTSVSNAAMRSELQLKLQDAVNSMEPLDREIIALRHFEELTNQETAELLDLSKTAASNRYVRAMTRLQDLLEQIPGLLSYIK